MPKAIRYKSSGAYLRNTLFWTQADYIGAYHADPAHFDAVLAAEEEAMTIASHKQNFAVAFGIPAEEIECEVIEGWSGDEQALPFADDALGELERIESAPAEAPPVQNRTLEDRLAELESLLKAQDKG